MRRCPTAAAPSRKCRLDGVQLASRVSTNGNESIRTVPLVGEICITLQAAETIENVGEAPAGIPKRNPAVVILRSSPLSEARVGCRAAPHDSGSRDRDSSVELLVGGVAPIVLDGGLRSIENIGGEGGDVRVVGSCLEQNHRSFGVLTQPRGEHAASRSSADDDDVERHGATITEGIPVTRSTACSESDLSAEVRTLRGAPTEFTGRWRRTELRKSAGSRRPARSNVRTCRFHGSHSAA